jgi:hypothetical protein
MARGRSRVPAEAEFVSYIVEIKSWDWSFSFSLPSGRYELGPYSDHRHLKVEGNLLRPKKVKADTVELTFLPSPRNDAVAREDQAPKCVGSLDLYRGRLMGLIDMPVDALSCVMQMLIAGRSKYVALHGHRMRYRKALLRGYSIDTNYEDENWPDE